MGSTHIESQLQSTGASKKAQNSTVRDLQPRRRLDADQTVFRVYKGVKTFDFCKEKNVIVTGGEILRRIPFKVRAITCKNYLLKIYSQHGNFLNGI